MESNMQGQQVNKLTSLKYWFVEYLKDHMTEGNIKTHYIGVPVVTVSLLGLLNPIGVTLGTSTITLSMVLVAIGLAWYFMLDKKLATLITIPMITMYYASTLMSVQASLILHAIGWVFQLVGHYKYEGRSPAFFKSLPQLLIGPLFIFAKTINYQWNKN